MNEQRWNNELHRAGGHLLQSWRWGEAKRRQGWSVERLHGATENGSWMAQVLIKSRGPISIAYVPNGPVLMGDQAVAFAGLQTQLNELCRERRAFSLIIEPTQEMRIDDHLAAHRFGPAGRSIQPRATITVPVRDDEAMLRAMHHKTRYHVRLAQRQGIVTSDVVPTDGTIRTFFGLHQETVRRNGIQELPLSYFVHLCDAFAGDVEIILAERDGMPVAAAMVVQFGHEAHYLFAGSSTEHRGQGAGSLVVFRTLQWARARGCVQVDLGSIEDDGLHTFKSGFGGFERHYMPALERRYQPAIATAVNAVLSARDLVRRDKRLIRAPSVSSGIRG